MPRTPETMLCLTEVAARIGCTERTIYKLIGRGEFPKPMAVAGRSRWPESDVTLDLTTRKRGLRKVNRKPKLTVLPQPEPGSGPQTGVA